MRVVAHCFPRTDSWEEPQDISAKFGCSVAVGEHSFAQMEEDVDRQKLLGQPSHQRIGSPATDIDHLTLQVQVTYSNAFAVNLFNKNTPLSLARGFCTWSMKLF